MSDYCDPATYHEAWSAARRLPDDAHLARIIEAVLDVAAPRIAAKALRVAALARENYNHSTRRAMLGREWDELTDEEQSGWLRRARERLSRPEGRR